MNSTNDREVETRSGADAVLSWTYMLSVICRLLGTGVLCSVRIEKQAARSQQDAVRQTTAQVPA